MNDEQRDLVERYMQARPLGIVRQFAETVIPQYASAFGVEPVAFTKMFIESCLISSLSLSLCSRFTRTWRRPKARRIAFVRQRGERFRLKSLMPRDKCGTGNDLFYHGYVEVITDAAGVRRVTREIYPCGSIHFALKLIKECWKPDTGPTGLPKMTVRPNSNTWPPFEIEWIGR